MRRDESSPSSTLPGSKTGSNGQVKQAAQKLIDFMSQYARGARNTLRNHDPLCLFFDELQKEIDEAA